MRQLPSRLRRLDDALADLPLDEPMLLTELDGFLSGILVCPEPIAQAEWLQNVWGSDESVDPPFDDPADVRWFVDAVVARRDEIARDMARAKPRPIFDVDERNGDLLWELWIDGFAEAMALRPDSWAAMVGGADTAVHAAASRLFTLIAVARNESDLDSVQINALHDRAPSMIIDDVLCLYRARPRAGHVSPEVSASAGPVKIGRNDPCRCGSGKKSKRCCG